MAQSEHLARYNLQQQQRLAQAQQGNQVRPGQPAMFPAQAQSHAHGFLGLHGPQALTQHTAQPALNAALTAMTPGPSTQSSTSVTPAPQNPPPNGIAQPVASAWFGNIVSIPKITR